MANNAGTQMMGRPILLMTRPRAASLRFVAALPDALRNRVEVVTAPLMQIVPIEGAEPLPEIVAAIFTSANGVSFAPEGADRAAFCVGQRTADAARAKGWQVDVTAQDAAELIGLMDAAQIDVPLTHLCGVHQRGDIAQRLSDKGMSVQAIAIYDQQLLPMGEAEKSLVSGDIPVLVPLFSPRTARQFAREVSGGAQVHVIALSAAVADEVRDLPLASLEVCQAPTAEEMRRSIEKRVGQTSLP